MVAEGIASLCFEGRAVNECILFPTRHVMGGQGTMFG